MIELLTSREIDQMRPAGRFVAEVLTALEDAADVGVNLLELDALAHSMIRDRGAESWNCPSPTGRYSPSISPEKFVTTTVVVPELSTSAASTPIPARARPSSLRARPALSPSSVNVPLPLLR